MKPSAPLITMSIRLFLALFFVAVIGAEVTKEICQMYCASVQGQNSYDTCSPWTSFATQNNLTCYNLCVYNCASVYEGSCMEDENFRCCLSLKPNKKPEFKTSGCNYLYNNVV